MPHDLEYPNSGGVADWATLYRARGEEVQAHRPLFTGDVFHKLTLTRESKARSVIVVQHPCALRTDGVTLRSRLLVAKVEVHPLIEAGDWTKHISKMPLPDLMPSLTSGRRHQAGFFDDLYLASPEELDLSKRIACLSQEGVNLILQRWVNHNSRMIVPTWQYDEVSSAQYEEADLTEYWCEERSELTIFEASVEALKWLREDVGSGILRQALLEQPQKRSMVRKEMRSYLRLLQEQPSSAD